MPIEKTYFEDLVSKTQLKIEYFCHFTEPLKSAWNNPWTSVSHSIDTIDTMSHFSIQNLIQRSGQTQKQHFVTTASIFFIDKFLRKGIIRSSDKQRYYESFFHSISNTKKWADTKATFFYYYINIFYRQISNERHN